MVWDGGDVVSRCRERRGHVRGKMGLLQHPAGKKKRPSVNALEA